MESKNEIQKLKAQCKVLESRSFPSVGCVEELEFQSNNDSHASHDESILLLGGFNGTSWLPDLDSYSLSRDSVKSLKPMRHVRIYSSAATLNGDLYVFGGGNGNLWYDTGIAMLVVNFFLFSLSFFCPFGLLFIKLLYYYVFFFFWNGNDVVIYLY